ncbi:MAG: putative glycoside hydrolase [Chloroflexota bacterium]
MPRRFNSGRFFVVLLSVVLIGAAVVAAVYGPSLIAYRNGGFNLMALPTLADAATVESSLLPLLEPVSQSDGSYPELAGRLATLLEQRIGRQPVEVRGIYMTGYTAGSTSRVDALIKLIDETELNAVVIDIKEDTGQISYRMDEPKVEATPGAAVPKIRDIDELLSKLHAHGIYPIARIVTFKDNVFANANPDLAVHTSAGGVWRDRTGQGWLNPYKKETWDYAIAVAKNAVKHGFREIQFDYVRFPSDGNVKDMVFPGTDERTHREVIRDFLKYANEQLTPLGVFVSADVFGLVTAAKDDLTIGQQYEDIIANVDYVCPMVYPSHYGPGNYGLPDPNRAPYETVLRAMEDALRRQGDSKAIVRPWLQDFSLGYKYGPAEVRAQIKAVYDAGLKEWILWNPYNKYTEGALEKVGE